MESVNSKEIKKEYISYSKKNNFIYNDSDPIIAPPDSRLLFNISGGVKYQEELLEKKKPVEDRVSSIQECVRTDNMDNIGITGRHHLYFEMIGHFMFYTSKEDECKKEFISFAYKYLTEVIGLDKNRLYATVFPEDYVTQEVWKSLGNKNIIKSVKNIFISPYADKSALRTEMLWEREDKSLVELWNLVFTQFNSKQIFEKPSEYIGADSGASLERIVTAYENKNNNYENSMWSEFVNEIGKTSQCSSLKQSRRIADFTNTSAKLIHEGITPGSKVQAYMLRKMLRTLFDMCDECSININDLLNLYLLCNPNINQELLVSVVLEEHEKYLKAISNGLKQAKKAILKNGIDSINSDYFKSTCGLPQKYIEKLISENKVLRLK